MGKLLSNNVGVNKYPVSTSVLKLWLLGVTMFGLMHAICGLTAFEMYVAVAIVTSITVISLYHAVALDSEIKAEDTLKTISSFISSVAALLIVGGMIYFGEMEMIKTVPDFISVVVFVAVLSMFIRVGANAFVSCASTMNSEIHIG